MTAGPADEDLAPDGPDTGEAVFTVVLEVDIGDADRGAFYAAWQRMAAAAARDPANLSQSLNADPTHGSTFYIVSAWADRERFRAFSTGAEHDAHVADLQAMGRTVSITQMHQVLTGPTHTRTTR